MWEARDSSLILQRTAMSNQQQTVEALKSDNEDKDLSEIIIDYTSSYTAYQASLQAAAKLERQTYWIICKKGETGIKQTTRLFGESKKLTKDKIITFEDGIIGFPDMKKFTLIFDEEKEADHPFPGYSPWTSQR